MRILIIDNYDSFTFNLRHLVESSAGDAALQCRVVRNDECTVDELLLWEPNGVVISPGPGGPQEIGVARELLALRLPSLPIWGVCLGHQAMAAELGGSVNRAPLPMHGKTSVILHSATGPLRGVPSPFSAMRYHSLAVGDASTSGYEVIARSEDGVVMALCARALPWWGVQFHPESFLTEHGGSIAANFIDLARHHSHKAQGVAA